MDKSKNQKYQQQQLMILIGEIFQLFQFIIPIRNLSTLKQRRPKKRLKNNQLKMFSTKRKSIKRKNLKRNQSLRTKINQPKKRDLDIMELLKRLNQEVKINQMKMTMKNSQDLVNINPIKRIKNQRRNAKRRKSLTEWQKDSLKQKVQKDTTHSMVIRSL